jgi:hypothetical protein
MRKMWGRWPPKPYFGLSGNFTLADSQSEQKLRPQHRYPPFGQLRAVSFKKRNDGAPSLGMVHVRVGKGGPPERISVWQYLYLRLMSRMAAPIEANFGTAVG